jgi:hypothetical protein
MYPDEEDLPAEEDGAEMAGRTISDAVRSSIVRFSDHGLPPSLIARNFRVSRRDVLDVLREARRQPNPEG